MNLDRSQPIREWDYTVGQSYDTASGRVITMTTRDDCPGVTMATEGDKAVGQVRIIPLSTGDVITGAPLVTISEVKTPSPTERDVIHSEDASRVRLDQQGGASVLTPAQLGSGRSPSPVRVVCLLVGWWLAWKRMRSITANHQ